MGKKHLNLGLNTPRSPPQTWTLPANAGINKLDLRKCGGSPSKVEVKLTCRVAEEPKKSSNSKIIKKTLDLFNNLYTQTTYAN